eukprot:gene34645-41954_t
MANAIIGQIYTAIENGDTLTAQKLCQKPQVAHLPLTKALLAYTHATQKHYDKAIELAKEAVQSRQYEEDVINAAGCALKLSRADSELAAYYEDILKSPRHASSTQYTTDLLNTYVRLNQPKRVQQQASRLYKMTDDAKYVYWQVTALLLQDDLPPAMLAVAEKMLRKVIFELSASSPLGAEELPLFLNVLLRAGKPAEALEALRSLHTRPRGAGIHDEDAFQQLPSRVGFSDMQRDLVEIDLLRLLLADSEAEEALARRCEAFLRQQADHWAAHRVLLDVVLRRALPPRTLGAWGAHREALSELMALRDVAFALPPLAARSSEAVDFSALAAYVSFLRGLQAACNHKSRGASLAELRALSVCLVHGDLLLDPSASAAVPAELLGGEASWLALLRRLLLRYVERFGAKTCCASDLLPVLHSLCEYVREQGREQGAAWLGELFAQLEGLRMQVLGDVHQHIGLGEMGQMEGMEGMGGMGGKGEDGGPKEGARDESEGEDDEDEKKKKNKHKKKKPAAPAAPSTSTTNNNNNNNSSGEAQVRPMD